MKNVDDLITVIIPVYNVKVYLKKCIHSVLKQTYSNLEIILVDDGSTDGSGLICDEFKKIDNRVVVIHKKNEGLGYARNSGLDKTTGEYVTFVDSDDYIEPTMVESLYKCIKRYNVDECKMGFERVNDESKVVGSRKYKFELFSGNEAKEKYAPRLIGASSKEHDSIDMCVWGTLFNYNLIRKYHLRFPSERELISEDLIFHLEYLQYAQGACTIENTEYKYRINEKSLSKKYLEGRIDKSLFFYENIIEILKRYSYNNNVLNRAKRMFFIHIKMAISQEIIYEGNKMSMAINNIKKICGDQRVKRIIDNYPEKELGLKQRIFLTLVRYRMGSLLYFFKKWGLY